MQDGTVPSSPNGRSTQSSNNGSASGVGPSKSSSTTTTQTSSETTSSSASSNRPSGVTGSGASTVPMKPLILQNTVERVRGLGATYANHHVVDYDPDDDPYVTARVCWAKMMGHPYWPSRLGTLEERNEVMNYAGRNSGITIATTYEEAKDGEYVCVYFFGSHQFGCVLKRDIHPYVAKFAELRAKLPSKQYALALEEADGEAMRATYPDGTGRCMMCGGTNNPSHIVLCDRCNGEAHMECLRPPLLSIPEGEWLCIVCEKQAPLTFQAVKAGETDYIMKKRKAENAREDKGEGEGGDKSSANPHPKRARTEGGTTFKMWTPEEDEILARKMKEGIDWKSLAKFLPGRTEKSCQSRAHFLRGRRKDKSGAEGVPSPLLSDEMIPPSRSGQRSASSASGTGKRISNSVYASSSSFNHGGGNGGARSSPSSFQAVLESLVVRGPVKETIPQGPCFACGRVAGVVDVKCSVPGCGRTYHSFCLGAAAGIKVTRGGMARKKSLEAWGGGGGGGNENGRAREEGRNAPDDNHDGTDGIGRASGDDGTVPNDEHGTGNREGDVEEEDDDGDRDNEDVSDVDENEEKACFDEGWRCPWHKCAVCGAREDPLAWPADEEHPIQPPTVYESRSRCRFAGGRDSSEEDSDPLSVAARMLEKRGGGGSSSSSSPVSDTPGSSTSPTPAESRFARCCGCPLALCSRHVRVPLNANQIPVRRIPDKYGFFACESCAGLSFAVVSPEGSTTNVYATELPPRVALARILDRTLSDLVVGHKAIAAPFVRAPSSFVLHRFGSDGAWERAYEKAVSSGRMLRSLDEIQAAVRALKYASVAEFKAEFSAVSASLVALYELRRPVLADAAATLVYLMDEKLRFAGREVILSERSDDEERAKRHPWDYHGAVKESSYLFGAAPWDSRKRVPSSITSLAQIGRWTAAMDLPTVPPHSLALSVNNAAPRQQRAGEMLNVLAQALDAARLMSPREPATPGLGEPSRYYPTRDEIRNAFETQSQHLRAALVNTANLRRIVERVFDDVELEGGDEQETMGGGARVVTLGVGRNGAEMAAANRSLKAMLVETRAMLAHERAARMALEAKLGMTSSSSSSNSNSNATDAE